MTGSGFTSFRPDRTFRKLLARGSCLERSRESIQAPSVSRIEPLLMALDEADHAARGTAELRGVLRMALSSRGRNA
jgi:hypothetical protein